MIRVCCVCLVMVFLSCKSKPDFSGHWVSVRDHGDSNYYNTIDIKDSVLWNNRGLLNKYGNSDGYPLHQIGNNKFEISDDKYLYGTIVFRNDTLDASDCEHFINRLYFVKEPSNFESDLFGNLSLQIELFDFSTGQCVNSISYSNHTFVNIGKVKSNKDSVAVQVLDSFIELNDMSGFLDQEKFRYVLGIHDKLNVVLVVDKNTPISIIKDVIKRVKDYDQNIEILFPLINRVEKKVCYVDILNFQKSVLLKN